MSKDDGGPAFPFTPNEQQKLPDGTWDQNTDFGEPGMCLRDWFAGQALAGMLVSEKSPEAWDELSECAYEVADAMIAESRKRWAVDDDDTTTKDRT